VLIGALRDTVASDTPLLMGTRGGGVEGEADSPSRLSLSQRERERETGAEGGGGYVYASVHSHTYASDTNPRSSPGRTPLRTPQRTLNLESRTPVNNRKHVPCSAL
jgi:hypothetical protein